MLTNVEFCNFHNPLPWKQSKMATKQNKLFAVCVNGIVCIRNLIAEIDTDTHYVYVVRRILSYVAVCMFNEFIFNICINICAFFQVKHHKTKTNYITTKSFWRNLNNYLHKQHAHFLCSNFVHSWANLGWRWKADVKERNWENARRKKEKPHRNKYVKHTKSNITENPSEKKNIMCICVYFSNQIT